MVAVRTHVENRQADRSHHEDHSRPGGEAGEHIGGGAGAKGGLRALSAEGAGEVSRTALLQQNDTNEEQAHNHMKNDDEVEKNLHSMLLSESARSIRARSLWCGGGDLNPYALWAPAPQAGASANFATSAIGEPYEYNKISRFGACGVE